MEFVNDQLEALGKYFLTAKKTLKIDILQKCPFDPDLSSQDQKGTFGNFLQPKHENVQN